MKLHNPPNHLKTIDKVWMFISVDETGEGVCAFPLRGDMLSVPMVAADEALLEQLKPIAKMMVDKYGIKIKLIELSTRTEIEDYEPGAQL